jgi:lipoate-protein ligase A
MNQWRFIFTGASDAFLNMALDEAISQSCERGYALPTLRLYLWKPPGISIGYFQTIEKTVDLRECKKSNVDVVRRMTGGRAVLHENEITYSLCARCAECPGLDRNTNETYQSISFALLESLKELGIQAEWVKPQRGRTALTGNSFVSKPCFVSNSRYEITVGGKKLIGSAQKREKSSFIQHGSVPLGNGKASLPEFLREKNGRDKMKKKLEEKSTNLERILKRKVEYQEVISALKRGFSRFFDVKMVEEELTQKELKTAQMLKEKKYMTEDWNLRRRFLPIQESADRIL